MSRLSSLHVGVVLGACVLACVGACVGAAGCKRAPSNEAARAEPQSFELEVTTPTRAMLPRTVRVTGTLFGEEEATIASKVSGRVVEILADLGDSVEPGAPLVRIDPTDYVLVRDERARAMVETLASIGLNGLPDVDEEFSIDEVPTVARAIVEAENASVRFERARQLAEREQPLMGPQEFSDIRTAYDVARANVTVQRLEARTILARARTLEAQVRIAAQRIDDSTARAPESGEGGDRLYRIASRGVSVGDFVQVGQALMRVVDSDPIKLRLNVPERRFSEIAPGQRASVVADAVDPRNTDPVVGVVSRLAPSLDVSTRTLPIEVLIPNSSGGLKPGGFATAEIAVGEEDALVVPASAILTFAGVHKVIIVADGSAQERRVQIGARAGDLVQILSGLKGDETIARSPPNSVTTGSRVRIVAETGVAGGGVGER
ncbi:MAG: efflux RND transporter periplasmic adaptor subunit [Phycisphaeraceae bacterium]|nr:MAG: efflux RND transporter periplasmic adaptor subunit [Phycisphaeraceae bacterium]